MGWYTLAVSIHFHHSILSGVNFVYHNMKVYINASSIALFIKFSEICYWLHWNLNWLKFSLSRNNLESLCKVPNLYISLNYTQFETLNLVLIHTMQPIYMLKNHRPQQLMKKPNYFGVNCRLSLKNVNNE